MEKRDVIQALGALAQEHRLEIFRLLVRQGADGLPAGRIGEAVGLAPSTLSFHLAQLSHAGLLSARREQRQIFYAVEIEQVRRLLGFLTEDCCAGRPEICGGLMQAAAVGGEDEEACHESV